MFHVKRLFVPMLFFKTMFHVKHPFSWRTFLKFKCRRADKLLQLSTRRHFRASRHTALSPAIGPRPQPRSAFERCGHPLPSSFSIIRMLCTLVERDGSNRRACPLGRGGRGSFQLVLPLTGQRRKRVIPSGVARRFLPRSLVRTSRATQPRNLSSIDRGAKLPRVPDPSRIENHCEIPEQTVKSKQSDRIRP